MVSTKEGMSKYDFNKFGCVAVVVDFSKLDNYAADVLELLEDSKAVFKLVDISNADHLYSVNWQEVNVAFILLGDKNPLAFGKIQGFLHILNIDYSGADLLAAALVLDRIKCKKIWQSSGIATPPFVRWQEPFDWQEILGLMGLPLVIKNLTATDNRVFKITHIKETKEIISKFDNAKDFILEPWIAGDKYLVYVINNRVLDPVRVCGNLNGSDNFVLADLKGSALSSMKKLALAAVNVIGAQGLAEVRILRDLNGDCWVLSINVSVAIAKETSIMLAGLAAGFSLGDLVYSILETSLSRKSCQSCKLTT